MPAACALLQRYCSHYMAIRVITAGLGCKGDFHCLSLMDGIVSNYQSLSWKPRTWQWKHWLKDIS